MHGRAYTRQTGELAPPTGHGVKCFYIPVPSQPCEKEWKEAAELYRHNCMVIYAFNEDDAKRQIARSTPWRGPDGNPILGPRDKIALKTQSIKPLPKDVISTSVTPTPIPTPKIPSQGELERRKRINQFRKRRQNKGS